MKSFKQLLETLNQRHIVIIAKLVDVADITPSVLIAFHQACLDVLKCITGFGITRKLFIQLQAGRHLPNAIWYCERYDLRPRWNECP